MIIVVYLSFLLGLAAILLVFIPVTAAPAPIQLRMPASPFASSAEVRQRLTSWRRFMLQAMVWVGRTMPAAWRHRRMLEERLVYIRSQLNPEAFFGVKLCAAVVGFFVAGAVMVELRRMEPLWLLLGVGVGFMAPELWLRGRLQRRQKAILRLLPEVIDLLMLCMGAGLDFLGALNKVITIKGYRNEPLIEELSTVLQEIKLGRRRFESMKTMARRINLTEMSSFVRTMVQADRMGTPINEVLTIHAEDVRFQRFQRAERAALKAPIKILVPLIFCIMPCVALVIGAPVFIQFMKQSPFGK